MKNSFWDKIIAFFTRLFRFKRASLTTQIEAASSERQERVIYYDHPLVVTKPVVRESQTNEDIRSRNSQTETKKSVVPELTEGELYCKVRPLFRSVGDVDDEIVRVGRKHPDWDRKKILEYVWEDLKRK